MTASGTDLRVSADSARRFLAARHLLSPARSATGGHDAVMRVVRRFGSVQFDPIAVAGRNHDLVLHARVAGYDPKWTEDLLYRRRELFETQNKGLSLLPMDELPWYRVSWMQDSNAREVVKQHDELVKRILDRITCEGPLTTTDVESGRTKNWWGGSMSLASAVMDALVSTGVLALDRREGNRRYFNLAERVYPAHLLGRKVPMREQIRHKLLSRFRAHGLLRGYSNAMIGIGPARPDPKHPDVPSMAELRADLLDAGTILPVRIEGVRTERFVLTEEVDMLVNPPKPVPSVSFHPPFDPLVWDVKFLKELYGFEYVLELWHPEHRRRWGYYVLPILFAGDLVGRIEPRIDRSGSRVRIMGVWWQDGFDISREDGFVEAMWDALNAYLGFANATELEWAPHLGREERTFSR